MKANYRLLSRYICRNDDNEVSKILRQDNSLNVMNDEGELFIAAIDGKRVEIVKTLLDYFNNNQLAKYKSDSTEYLLLKKQMRDVLEIAIEDVNLSEEMQEVLNQYLPIEEDSYQEQDIEDIVMPFFNKSNEDIKHTELTEYNLKKLAAVENNQVKNFEDLMGFYSPTPPMRKSHSMDDIRNHSGEKSNSTHDNSGEKLLTLDQLKEFRLHFDNDHKDEIHSTGEISHHSDDLY